MERTILHSDLNCYYASVEMMLHPELRGHPVAVCGSVEDRHGIVLTKSQLAKEAGVKTGQAIWQAKQSCPKLIIVRPHYDQYLKYSALVHEVYNRYTDRIEPFGIDECWMDVSGSDGKTVADELRETIKNELGLTVSVGVSFNKIFAKLGSDMKKPDGTTVISEDSFKQQVWPLPTSELLFVGRATEKKLRAFGITTIGGIANADPEQLRSRLGINGVKIWQFANGYDRSRVCSFGYKPPAKSVGHGLTFTADLVDNLEVYRAFLELAYGVSKKLRATNVAATAVSIYVRNNRLYWEQHQTRLKNPSQSWRELAETAYVLFREKYLWQYPVRSLTITAIRLIPADAPRQMEMLYDYAAHDKQERLEKTILDIRTRFGDNAVTLAGLMDNKKLPSGRLDEQFVLPNAMYQ